MGIVRIAVVLYSWPAGQQLELRDKEFYERYFFHPAFGQAAYWAKQTNSQVILTGQVFDWAFDQDPNPRLDDRTAVINTVISTMQESRDIGFGSFDLVIVVLGIPASVPSDGGSTTVKSNTRTHAGIAMRAGDRFDFVEHEIGHALGLDHSFGNPLFQLPGTMAGEYGHPYCVMSAMAYGGIGGPFIDPSPREGAREYRLLGPSLNAATALANGWIDAYDYSLAGAQPREFVVRSRANSGPRPDRVPQAVNVRAVDGQNYVIEYRENEGWDRGQGSPVVIVNHGQGSTADLGHPGHHSATFLALIRLPISLGGVGSIYQGPGFGLQMLGVSPLDHTVTFKLFPGRAPLVQFELTSKVDLLEEKLLSIGETTFVPGKVVCAEGTWTYRKIAQTQVATFEATYALATNPISATWILNGQELIVPAETINQILRVTTASPTLDDQTIERPVGIRYAIVAIPHGSRLQVFNRPEDETFRVDVEVTLSTGLGYATDRTSAKFRGIQYVYPKEFTDQRWACLSRRLRDRVPKYKVLIPPESWQKNPEERFAEIEDLLGGLASLLSAGEEHSFQQALLVLEDLTGVSPDQVKVVELDRDIVSLGRPSAQFELSTSDFPQDDHLFLLSAKP